MTIIKECSLSLKYVIINVKQVSQYSVFDQQIPLQYSKEYFTSLLLINL